MLVGARHPGATVGAVEKEYRSEVNSCVPPVYSQIFIQSYHLYECESNRSYALSSEWIS